jgi:uncharacterized membrane protein YsdA (DUF1294 family)
MQKIVEIFLNSISWILQERLEYMLIFAGFNLTCFLVYTFDKWLAIKGRRRISEKSLLVWSFLGPIGALFGVFLVRHKSKKVTYLIKLAVSLMLSLLAWGILFYKTLTLFGNPLAS